MTTRRPGVLRQLSTLGSGTVLAALLGLGLQGLLAWWFGTGAESDAWFWSLSIYAFLAKFLMLSQLKSLSIPAWIAQRDADPTAARSFVGGLLSVGVVGLGAAVLLLAVAAPWLVDVLAPGLEGEQRELTTLLLRIRLPALVALVVTMIGLIVLEADGQFGRSVSAQRLIPAGVSLAALAALGGWLGIVGAGIAGLLGGLAGGTVVIGALRQHADRVGPVQAWRNADVRGVLRRWLSFSTSNAATFLGEWVYRIGASLLPLGYFSAVVYGRMVHDLAHGALNDSASSVSLPRFSRAAREPGGMTAELRRAVSTLAGVALPVALFLALTSPRLVELLFGRGQFAEDGLAFVAAEALSLFCVGLFVQGINQLLFAGLFATGQGTRVNQVQLLGHLARAVWMVPLVLWLSFRGLVIAQVLMNVLVALLLLVRIPREWWSAKGLGLAVLRLAAAGGLAAWAATLLLARAPAAETLSLLGQVVSLSVAGIGWVLLYGTLAVVVRAPGSVEIAGLLRRRWAGTAVVLLAAALTLGAPASAQAQEGQAGSAVPMAEDPALRAFLAQLEARGLVPAGSSVLDPLTARRVEEFLIGAGAAGSDRLTALRARFAESGIAFSVLAGATAADAGPGATGGTARPFAAADLRLGSGASPFFGWLNARLPDGTPEGWPAAQLHSEASLLPVGRLTPVQGIEGGLGAELGPVVLTLARSRFQLGGSETGAITLNRSAPLDVITLASNGPVRIPILGEAEWLLALSPRLRYDAVEDPWFVLGRYIVRPHPSLQIGLSRAAQFGGRFPGGTVPYDPVVYGPDDRTPGVSDVFQALLGRVNQFDNQVGSVDLRWSMGRLGVPVLVRAEVGFEDNARSFGDPAVQLGFTLAPSTAMPLSLRYDYTAFGQGARYCDSCDDLPAYWYWNTRFQDGWRSRDGILGHPLGGYGRRHELGLDLWPAAGTFVSIAGGQLRRSQWNLLEPARPGDALHASLKADVGLSNGLRARLSAAVENGADWRIWQLEGGLEWRISH